MNTYASAFVQTLKEAPNDAEVISHQLMVRAGMIRKVASGVYSILPLGQRVFNKMSAIIRDEMSKIGAAECELPHLIPAELWKMSGRWDQYGKELLRLTDRSDREFCFGPTHEEVITDLVNHYVISYKQLPVYLYQIQTKFRDEIRPRFGLMRGREFLMKDGYSFHESTDSLNDTYENSRHAYVNIFNRCGLNFIEASADSGSIGGDESAEFLVLADSGEDEILVCEPVGYAANIEAAVCLDVNHHVDSVSNAKLQKIQTPKVTTIHDLESFFGVKSSEILKSMLVIVDDKPIMFCCRGDHQLNETKLQKILNAPFRFATPLEIETFCGCLPGFIGPYNLPSNMPIYLDFSLKQFPHFICGANETDQHFSQLVIDRDIQNFSWVDIRNAQVGDPCPTDPQHKLTSIRGIEVGHIFKLGSKYSTAMNATFTHSSGKSVPFEMGCYGIGVGRTIAAAIEQSHDENGIVWPVALAPFEVVIISLVKQASDVAAIIDKLLAVFKTKNLDVIVDDRKESPGIKFKDADLIGFPFQIILGKKTIESQKIEIKYRKSGKKEWISLDKLDSIELKV